MLKVEIKGKGAVIEATGSTMDLAVETAALISGIYNQLKQSQPVAALVYRDFVMKSTEGDGAVWMEPEGMAGIAIDKGMRGSHGSK